MKLNYKSSSELVIIIFVIFPSVKFKKRREISREINLKENISGVSESIFSLEHFSMETSGKS